MIYSPCSPILVVVTMRRVECVGTVQEAGKNCVQILLSSNQTRTTRTVMQRYFSQPHAKVQSKPCAVLHVCIGNGGSQLPTLQSSDHTMIDSTHRESAKASDQTSVTHSASKVGPISGVIYCSLSPSFPCLSPRSVSSSISESQFRHGTVITVTYVARSTFVKMV